MKENETIEKVQIPKQIFFFWGNEKMSWMRYMTLKSFRMFNPTWKMILYFSVSDVKNKQWTSIVQQDFFTFNGVDYTEELKTLNIEFRYWDISNNKIIKYKTLKDVAPSHMSNFFKWYTLYSEGGIYSDMDIIYYKSIDPFYNTMIDNGYDTAICDTYYLSIGFLAAAKGNIFYKDIFEACYDNYDPSEYQSAGVKNIEKFLEVEHTYYYNFGKTFELAKNKYPLLKFYNIPFELVYPLNHLKIQYAFTNDIKITDLPEITVAYHWYAGHPIAQHYNSLLTEENFREYNFTFVNIVKEILQ